MRPIRRCGPSRPTRRVAGQRCCRPGCPGQAASSAARSASVSRSAATTRTSTSVTSRSAMAAARSRPTVGRGIALGGQRLQAVVVEDEGGEHRPEGLLAHRRRRCLEHDRGLHDVARSRRGFAAVTLVIVVSLAAIKRWREKAFRDG